MAPDDAPARYVLPMACRDHAACLPAAHFDRHMSGVCPPSARPDAADFPVGKTLHPSAMPLAGVPPRKYGGRYDGLRC